MDDPESHGAPVEHHKNAKVDVENRGKQSEGEHPRGDGKEAPEQVHQGATVTHALLVVTRVTQEFVPLGVVALNHDAELQHQLRGAFQEGLEQAQHVDIGVLVHHSPVETPLVLLLPVALYTEPEGVSMLQRKQVARAMVLGYPTSLRRDQVTPLRRVGSREKRIKTVYGSSYITSSVPQDEEGPGCDV
ncbi:hypothetical protein EYF80_007085 [Liparis tanakae]|uniref:Uncharacterized protein n=1 Tax=Liparis tanakae TaxID=230148 RepID=A0A4Z2IXR7_9TELE|nr:hypothetical protein EYF80_007085 [Liparis tanakae]